MFEWIGWVATALFAASYLCKQANVLRVVQAVAALLWIGYGLVIGASPVVVANLIVAVMAAGSVALQLQRNRKNGEAISPVRIRRIRRREAHVGSAD